MAKFQMKGDLFEIVVKSASSTKVEIEIAFSEKEITEQELRNLEAAIRLLLEACGRYNPNPSRR